MTTDRSFTKSETSAATEAPKPLVSKADAGAFCASTGKFYNKV